MTSLQAPSSDTVTLGVRPSCLPPPFLAAVYALTTTCQTRVRTQHEWSCFSPCPRSSHSMVETASEPRASSGTPQDLPLWSQSGPGGHSHPGTPVRRKFKKILFWKTKSCFQRVALEFYYSRLLCEKGLRAFIAREHRPLLLLMHQALFVSCKANPGPETLIFAAEKTAYL